MSLRSAWSVPRRRRPQHRRPRADSPSPAAATARRPRSAKVAAGPMPEGETWTGRLLPPGVRLPPHAEEGSNVVGRWKRTNQSKWGELSGTMSGNVLHYTWKEHTVGMVGASATTQGKGYFAYKMDKERSRESRRPVRPQRRRDRQRLEQREAGAHAAGHQVDRRRLRRRHARRLLNCRSRLVWCVVRATRGNAKNAVMSMPLEHPDTFVRRHIGPSRGRPGARCSRRWALASLDALVARDGARVDPPDQARSRLSGRG